MSDDGDPTAAADLSPIFMLVNEKGKFAVDIGYHDDINFQLALERAIDEELLALVDVSPIGLQPNRIFRVFRLTAAGRERHKVWAEARKG